MAVAVRPASEISRNALFVQVPVNSVGVSPLFDIMQTVGCRHR